MVALISITLHVVMTRMMRPEVVDIPGGRVAIPTSLAALGPMTMAEKKLLALSLTLLVFWSTEGVLHRFDISTATIVALALVMLRGTTYWHWLGYL
jgi:di/tricarboxylate transporter